MFFSLDFLCFFLVGYDRIFLGVSGFWSGVL